jgi:hypothetical protein
MLPRRIGIFTLVSLLASACASDGGGKSSTGGSGGTGATGGSGGTAGGGSGGGGSGGSGGGGAGGSTPDSGTAGADAGTVPDGGGKDGPPGASADCTSAQPNSLFCDPFRKMPANIKELGLFPSAPDLNKHPASLLEYSPDPALWSDGMEKQRFLLLPAGTKIDNSNSKIWVFPPGTIFVKTFFDDGGPGGASRAIETRFIRQGKKDAPLPYEFYVYRWVLDGPNPGTDATLVVDDMSGDPNKETLVPITIKRMVNNLPFTVNNGQPFMHSLPSRKACGDCHEENGMVAQTFIGFDELRLNSKSPATAAKTQLQVFYDAGVLSTMPANPASIPTEADQRMFRIKRFVFGNCVHCHNGNSVFDLHPEMLVANTVNKPTEAQSVVPPKGWLRIIPRNPEQSVLYVQVRRKPLPPPTGGGTMNRLRAMPPVGVADVAAEAEALKDIFDWIMSLK